MDYQFYKVLHLVGIFMIIISIGGLIVHRINGGKREQPWRFSSALTHGLGMAFALVGGFGMLARLGIHWPWPTWIVLKFVIWIYFGIIMSPILRRDPNKFLGAKHLWWLSLALGAVAAYAAIYKF